MGALSDLNEEVKDAFQIKDKCHFCGEEAVAYWSEMGKISVCYSCAVDILPKLIADAVGAFGAKRHVPHLATESAWKDIEGRFWRALALRLAREAQCK